MQTQLVYRVTTDMAAMPQPHLTHHRAHILFRTQNAGHRTQGSELWTGEWAAPRPTGQLNVNLRMRMAARFSGAAPLLCVFSAFRDSFIVSTAACLLGKRKTRNSWPCCRFFPTFTCLVSQLKHWYATNYPKSEKLKWKKVHGDLQEFSRRIRANWNSITHFCQLHFFQKKSV